MSVVRRGSAVSVAGVAVAGAVLLGGPAWAQEAPPDDDPVIAQSGLPSDPDTSDTGTVGIDPDAPVDDSGPCTTVQPAESGDEGIAVGEPVSGGDSDETVPGEGEGAGESKPEPAADEQGLAPAEDAGAPAESSEPADDGVICIAAGAPNGSEMTGGSGTTQVDAAAAELPRTGSSDRLLALTVVGAGLVLVGAGASAAGRRRVRPARG